MRFLADFTPQAWINDYAVTCDAEGESSWEVTEHLQALAPTTRRAVMEGDSHASDSLRDLPQVPAWVRAWSGPYRVDVRAVAESEADRALLGLVTDAAEVFAWDWQGIAGRTHTFRHRTDGAMECVTLDADGRCVYAVA